MALTFIDWLIVIAYLVISMAIGVVFLFRGRRSSEEYFKSGGGTAWWLLGTSMVATTFAADTPLALSGMVVTSGISQNWFWWCQVPMTLAVVFFFASLWKRANPMTDMEFVYVRYSGKSASFLRGFKALYLAIPYNCIIMGWVNLAMASVINLTFPSFPRIPGIDKLMLYIFMVTPLSSGINHNIKEAYFRGDIQPLKIADYYKLNTYDNIWTFKEFNAGVFNSNQKEFLKRLNIDDGISTNSVAGIEGIHPGLYLTDSKNDSGISGTPGNKNEDSGKLLRPVVLADGSSVEYQDTKRLFKVSSGVGEKILKEEDRKLKIERPLLADIGSLNFFNNIYDISSGVNQYKILLLLFILTVIYTAMSGLWGVLVTDFFQFWLAMLGCIALAVFAVNKCGGIDGMFHKFVGIYGLEKSRAMVSILPKIQAGSFGLMQFGEFLIYILVVWWTVGFTDGGLMAAQRMLSAKNERHAALGYLWFSIAHFALRMWPWLIVGFAAAVIFPYVPYPNGELPGTAVAEQGYVRIILNVLGPGWFGLLIATFLAAYMSTISSQINLGASYLMNDFYRPFVKKTASEKHYVKIGTYSTLIIAFFGIVSSLFMNNIKDAWFLLSSISSGIGVVAILRWYWHRVNAWTEITSFVVPIFLAATFAWFKGKYNIDINFPYNVLIVAPVSLGFALLITLFTKPTDKEKLIEFCKKVQPGGPGWKEIEDEIKKTQPDFKQFSPLSKSNLLNWGIGVICVYCFLFGIGKIIIGNVLYPNYFISNRLIGIVLIIIGIICGFIISKSLSHKNWEKNSK